MEKEIYTLGFYGGAEMVTGSNFLLSGPSGSPKILVDCGLFQGCRLCGDYNEEPFPYEPKSVDVLIVTHGHLDHVGRIPKLVHDGFRGTIYSTPGTRDLAELVLIDSMGIMEKEARRENKRVLYEKTDVETAMSLWRTVPYHDTFALPGGLEGRFKDAGHILGSAMTEISKNGKKIVFTGDLGNSPAPLLRDTEVVDDATYLVMETVYGDRNHEGVDERTRKLEHIIEETMHAGGALMIPAFSIERTQVLLFELNQLVEHKKIMPVPIFLDSPLAIKATAIYDKYERYFNNKTMGIIKSGDDIFNFPGMKSTLKTEESKAINDVPNPKVIMAGSGMSEGGRIIHHEKRYLPDPKSTLLLIGYQAPRTLGRMLQDGAKEITIAGEKVPVRARVANIRGFSAHKDSDGLLDFVSHAAPNLEKVFLAMGEPKSSLHFAQRLYDNFGMEAVIPKKGETFDIEF
ncbi:MAG: MBL fold hydrolase [Candidatus Lloydbacteria bacterium CG22_combo_CG10-13_8_21_14_all_47_15]|uniref:MBL fold hydrolase n=1 Tax=Candidatus Lloydbacteria bacterium CG22_combo_CG10-13_8_21_14_all_47_15 TaxID=1974635 RepID=A0A2H0CW49_9BACT|nr:MAG: MBL fold hydrolase [Candidatus Lloydbacteria bacterium CG22_combo_CG10-13_8_21_14_all_47_15]